MKKFTFGIDLGTTNSCVSYRKDGTDNVVPTKTGKRTLPSFVAYKGDEILVGDVAKQQVSANVKNTVYGVKRLIGHKFSEEGVKQDVKLWSFRVIADDDDNPLISLNPNGTEKLLKPQEISSNVLKELATMVCQVCNKNPDEEKNVVITVPAYFNDIQRRATIEAGELAGLNVLQIINEPTAAAIAYGYKYVKEKANRTILVYDFGGGTFDVSIIEVKNNEITVKATGGDTHLGGEDIDNNLVNYYINKLKDDAGVDITKDPKKLWKLRNACEEAKIMLSEMSEASVASSILEDNDIDTTLSVALFNQLNKDLFDKTITIVQQVLAESKLSKESIDDVVLIGGSSRIPEVQKLLSNLFSGKPINKDINPDEAVAIGAGILAEDVAKGNRDITSTMTSTSFINKHQTIKPFGASSDDGMSNIKDSMIIPEIEIGREENESRFKPPSPKIEIENGYSQVFDKPPSPKVEEEEKKEEENEEIKVEEEEKEEIKEEEEVKVEEEEVKVEEEEEVKVEEAKEEEKVEEEEEMESSKIIIHDILSQPIGIRAMNDKMSIILEKNSSIPCTNERKYYTPRDNTKDLAWGFYQGENPIASKNSFLYKYSMVDLPLKKKGEICFTTSLSIDINGTLNVVVKEKNNLVNDTNLKITVKNL